MELLFTDIDARGRARLTPEDMRVQARKALEAKELEKVGRQADGKAVTLADVRAAARRRRAALRRASKESTGQDSFRSSSSSTSSLASSERCLALESGLETGSVTASLVANRPLAVREEVHLESPLRSVLKAGTQVHVLEERELKDGTRRALVSRQGQPRPHGWVSMRLHDGTQTLVTRAAAFRERLAATLALEQMSDDERAATLRKQAAARRHAAQRAVQRREMQMLLSGRQAAYEPCRSAEADAVGPVAAAVAAAARPPEPSGGTPERKRSMPRAASKAALSASGTISAGDEAESPPKLRRGDDDGDVTPPKLRLERSRAT